jgi:hypothetical protein
MNHHYCTTLDTATIDQVPLTVEPVETPLDFGALRKAADTLAKFRFTSFLVWTDEACAALDMLQESAPSLIAMAERGEKLAADVRIERQRFMAISAEAARTNEQLGAALNRAEAERDRLKTQLAEAVASRDYAEEQLAAIESQPSGLSEEQETALYEVLDRLARFGYRTSVDTLRSIIDYLKRQKAVPWKKIRRVEKSGYYFWGSESEAHRGYLNAGSEASEPVYHVSFDDVLATLPKGDVTP